jgi:nucleoside-diphosphate-sugar epimerase
MKIGVTGANGFVGSSIVQTLELHGHEVVRLIRRAECEGDRLYALGEPVAKSMIMDLDAVVHAAWDFSVVGKSILRTNCYGSMPLLEAASSLGVRVILVSTMSAFEGCTSVYGKAKLELERLVFDCEGASFRAGVIFGKDSGGIFGSLLGAIRQGAVVPVFDGGRQQLSVSWDKSIGKLVESLVRLPILDSKPILAAHEKEVTFRSLITDLANSEAVKLRLCPINWRLGWVGLRSLEALRLRPPFRSDSLLALVNPMPQSQRSALAASPVEFPMLTHGLWKTDPDGK